MSIVAGLVDADPEGRPSFLLDKYHQLAGSAICLMLWHAKVVKDERSVSERSEK